jgi:hypothetical protein
MTESKVWIGSPISTGYAFELALNDDPWVTALFTRG